MRLPENPKILVTRIDRIGDVVLSTPVYQAVKEAFPGGKVGVLVSPLTAEVVSGNPFVDEVLLYDKRGKEKSVSGSLAFARELRRQKWDAVIHLHSTRRMHGMAFAAGIPVRIGYRKKWGGLLTHAVEENKWRGERHEAEYNFDLLFPLNIAPPVQIRTFFPLRGEVEEKFSRIALGEGLNLQRMDYMVINPAASCPSKFWPAEYFAELADSLIAKYRCRVVLIGGPDDEAISRQVRSRMKNVCVDLTGKLSLGELGWCLQKSVCLISNDTGPAHIAAACGTPVLSIFGRNQPGLSAARWKPLGPKAAYIQKDVGCFNCAADQCRIGFLCLKALQPGEVMGKLAAMEGWFLNRVEGKT